MTASARNTNRKRKWPRYTLKTILVVMAGLCIVLSLTIARARRQKSAVKAFEKLGATVGYDSEYQNAGLFEVFEKEPPFRVRIRLWLAKSLGEDFVYQVTHLDNWGKPIKDSDLIALTALPDIQSLRLTGSSVSEKGLRYVAELENLESLSLSGATISGVGLRSLTHLQRLNALDLKWTNITDEDTATIKKFSNLTKLTLPEGITDVSVKNVKSLKNLDSLFLCNSAITDAGLAQLNKLPLETLGLFGTPNITSEGLRNLPRSIKRIYIVNTSVGDEGIRFVSEISGLEELEVSGSQITDQGLRFLEKTPSLRSLRLEYNKIGDKGLKHLAKLHSLNELMLGSTNVTDKGVAKLEATLPECEIYKELVQFWPYWP